MDKLRDKLNAILAEEVADSNLDQKELAYYAAEREKNKSHEQIVREYHKALSIMPLLHLAFETRGGLDAVLAKCQAAYDGQRG